MPLFDESELSALATQRNAAQTAAQAQAAAEQQTAQTAAEIERIHLYRAIVQYTQAAQEYLRAVKQLGIHPNTTREVVTKEKIATEVKKLFGTKYITTTQMVKQQVPMWVLFPRYILIDADGILLQTKHRGGGVADFPGSVAYEPLNLLAYFEEITHNYTSSMRQFKFDVYPEHYPYPVEKLEKPIHNCFCDAWIHNLHQFLLSCALRYQVTDIYFHENTYEQDVYTYTCAFTTSRSDSEMQELIDETFREHLRMQMQQ